MPVKKARMKIHLGMKKGKKERPINASSEDEVLQRAYFYLTFGACTQYAFQF